MEQYEGDRFEPGEITLEPFDYNYRL